MSNLHVAVLQRHYPPHFNWASLTIIAHPLCELWGVHPHCLLMCLDGTSDIHTPGMVNENLGNVFIPCVSNWPTYGYRAQSLASMKHFSGFETFSSCLSIYMPTILNSMAKEV